MACECDDTVTLWVRRERDTAGGFVYTVSLGSLDIRAESESQADDTAATLKKELSGLLNGSVEIRYNF